MWEKTRISRAFLKNLYQLVNHSIHFLIGPDGDSKIIVNSRFVKMPYDNAFLPERKHNLFGILVRMRCKDKIGLAVRKPESKGFQFQLRAFSGCNDLFKILPEIGFVL